MERNDKLEELEGLMDRIENGTPEELEAIAADILGTEMPVSIVAKLILDGSELLQIANRIVTAVVENSDNAELKALADAIDLDEVPEALNGLGLFFANGGRLDYTN